MIVYTHINVDLDACIGTCVELYRNGLVPNECTVEFVSADYKDNWEGMIPVDIAARKHGNGASFVGAFCSDILPSNVVEEVNEQDSTGHSSNRVPLTLLVAALAENGFSDLGIIQQMFPIVVGFIKLQAQWRQMEEFYKSLKQIEIGRFRFLITGNSAFRQLSSIAKRDGLDGSIFWSDTGYGISRYPGKNEPDLSLLELDGWFAHPLGFLFCWGSRKAPKTEPPPQFQTVEEFIVWLQNQLIFT